jgi:uncharacterized protein YuzE
VLSVTPADTDPAGSYLPLPGVMLWLTPSPPVTLDYDERAGVLYVRHEGTTLAKTLPSVDDLTWMHVDADGYVIGLTIEAADKMTEAQLDEHPEAGDIPLAMRLAVRAWLTRPAEGSGRVSHARTARRMASAHGRQPARVRALHAVVAQGYPPDARVEDRVHAGIVRGPVPGAQHEKVHVQAVVVGGPGHPADVDAGSNQIEPVVESQSHGVESAPRRGGVTRQRPPWTAPPTRAPWPC